MHHDRKGTFGGYRGGVGGSSVSTLSMQSGHSVEYLTSAVAAGRENYYTGAVAAGEPPGRWSGRGAAALGLSGEVDAQDMTALYEHWIDPRDDAFGDPDRWEDAATLGRKRRFRTAAEILEGYLAAEPLATPERREELRTAAERNVKGGNVPFYDATFSVQKSITVLHAAFERAEVAAREAGHDAAAAAWAEHRVAVEAAIWTGNQASLDYLSTKAGYSRVGHHGGSAGRWTDAHDWTVASFFQHDNRDHDPQLHIHNAILARVQCADGQWRGLDGASLYAYRRAASAVGERAMEEYLTRVLGVAFVTRPDGKSREVAGIPATVMDLFSKRRRAVTAKTEELVAAYTREYGHEPNSLVRSRLAQQAALSSRRAKSHDGETIEERLHRWDGEVRAEVAGGLATVAEEVLALRQAEVPAADFSPSQVLATALESVQQTKATWQEADLAAAISDALPDHLGGMEPAQIATLIDGLTAEGLSQAIRLDHDGPASESLPDELRTDNGSSVYDRPGGRHYALPGHVAAERRLQQGAVERGARKLEFDQADAFLRGLAEQGIELGPDQSAALAGVLTSGARLEALVGPAGTGKSFVLGALARAWSPAGAEPGSPRVFGLASSQVAAEVLTGEGLTASNIARWLATQRRIAEGTQRLEDVEWRLRKGDLVVVDESAMSATVDLAAIYELATDAGAKLLLTGDHRQLAAVGAGGAMRLVAEEQSYELSEVRRFRQEWERDASLRLREGDASVLREYRLHGRIIDGGTVEQAGEAAMRGWLTDTLEGRQSLLIADTNEQAAQLSARARAELVRLGQVQEAGVELAAEGTIAGPGDRVQARLNGWDLAGRDGNRRGPINRETYTVLETLPDGGLVVATEPGDDRLGERITLPSAYVAEHVRLGYASTAHSAQGQTVDTCHTVATGRRDLGGLYVGMSRGRDRNTAYVVTLPLAEDAEPGEAHGLERADAAEVLRNAFDAEVFEESTRSAVAEAEAAEAEASTVRPAAERFADVVELATAGRLQAWLDQLVNHGRLTDDERCRLVTSDGLGNLTRLLRRVEVAGHEPQRVLTDAIERRQLGTARNLSFTLQHRITTALADELAPAGDAHSDWIPAVEHDGYRTHLQALAAEADERRDELGAQAVAEPPQWAVEALGPIPDDPVARAEWQHAAGLAASVRELHDFVEPDQPLPPRPQPGRVEAHAAWVAAATALGYTEQLRDEVEMSDGQLLARVRAWDRERAWEPAYVAAELSGTAQAEQRARETATLRRAALRTERDAEQRARLAAEADAAEAEADRLAEQRKELEDADQVRSRWYAHTAATRLAATNAEQELDARGIDPRQPVDAISAADWLAAHAAADHDDDETRPIRDDTEFADVAAERAQERDAQPLTGPEDAGPDVRARTAEQTHLTHSEDWSHVPSAGAVSDAVARAQQALVELEDRDTTDATTAMAPSAGGSPQTVVLRDRDDDRITALT